MRIPYIRLFLAFVAPAAAATNVDNLIDRLIQVESHGNAAAVGDGGKAIGILQIHSIAVQEANRLSKTRFVHSDMFDPTKAKEVARIILNHYSNHIQKTTGRPATDKELAFIWNGGGNAWKRASSPVADSKQKNLETYWKKVASSR